MSRGGRGGGRGGGRSGFGGGGSSSLPPMGLTFADIQNLSREATAMYPPRQLPIATDPTEEEKRIAEYQLGFATRIRKSPYYIVEKTRSTELPRYSDKYRPSVNAQPRLKRSNLNEAFFPPSVFDSYFNPKKRRADRRSTMKKHFNLNDIQDEDEGEKSGEGSDAGSEAAESDYDVEEEYDNDYAENYFDNGEGDDIDDLGGGGGDDYGGGGDYD